MSVNATPCDKAVVLAGNPPEASAKSAQIWVLAATILGSSLSFVDGTVVNVALPILQRDLGADLGMVQWIVEAYALMVSALILVGGSLGDRFGRRRIFSIGVVIFAFASLACALSQDIGQLIFARAAQGIGAALLVPGSLAIISASFAEKDRARAIGTWSGFTSVSAGLGPVLGGWLVEHFSWHWIFLINLPIAAIVLVLTWTHVPESKDETASKRLDVAGSTTATLALGTLVYGLIEGGRTGFHETIIQASLVAAAILLVVFFYIEYVRGDAAMMPLALFKSQTFLGANLLTLFLYAALNGLMFFLPFNLIQVQGYSPVAAGAALVPFVLTMFVLSRWAGGLLDKYGARLPLVIGPLIAAVGLALFIVPGAAAGSYWTSFFPAVMVMSVGMAISVAPLSTTVMNAAGARHAGVGSGINNAVARTGGLLAIAVLGIVMSTVYKPDIAGIEAASEAEFFVTGFRLVMAIAAGLAALSAFCAFMLIRRA